MYSIMNSANKEAITAIREKGRDLTQSYDKSPYTNRKIKKATWQHKNATKNLITQRLRTDLRRTVGVTTVTPLTAILHGHEFFKFLYL